MRTSIPIQNVMCGGCCTTISSEISKLDCILDVDMNLENSTVSFNYKEASDVLKVKEKLESLGYPPKTKNYAPPVKAKSFLNRITNKFSK